MEIIILAIVVVAILFGSANSKPKEKKDEKKDKK